MINERTIEPCWDEHVEDWPPELVERFNREYERFCRERGLLTGAKLYRETNKQFYERKRSNKTN